jgi:anti-sigma B factor antagonist
MDSIATLRVDRTRAGVGVLELGGDYDMANAPELEAALEKVRAEQRGIVLDLSETTFIDSTIIHVVVRTQRALAGQGSQLALRVQTASIVRRALDVSELAKVVLITADREQAIAIATGASEAAAPRDQA